MVTEKTSHSHNWHIGIWIKPWCHYGNHGKGVTWLIYLGKSHSAVADDFNSKLHNFCPTFRTFDNLKHVFFNLSFFFLGGNKQNKKLAFCGFMRRRKLHVSFWWTPFSATLTTVKLWFRGISDKPNLVQKMSNFLTNKLWVFSY